MRALVTGAAGFIGSHLTARLLSDGHDVVAVDRFTPYYDPAVKRDNLRRAVRGRPAVLMECDASDDRVLALLPDVDTVFHLAAQPGVRPSWATFETYLRENVGRVHRLLEAAQQLPRPPQVVLASSSSVYGELERYPCDEDSPLRPVSPYGVSKLCMEQLAAAYVAAYGLPIVCLRYFTVYGPRQRPDMAFHRFLHAALADEPVPVYGDGRQVREFTYVHDVVEATVRAGTRPVAPGTAINVCGGQPVTVLDVLDVVAELTGRPLKVEMQPAATGDVRRTGGRHDRAREQLGWRPTTSVRDGLAAQLAWHQERLAQEAGVRVGRAGR